MKTFNHHGVAGRFRAAVLAAGLALPGVCGVLATPALAQTVLGAAQVASIQTLLEAMLYGVKDNDAVAAAISQSEQSSIIYYGTPSAYSVTSAVMSISESLGYSPCLIGAALGNAATTLMPTNKEAAKAIAQTVANEGKSCARVRFLEVVLAGTGNSELAAIVSEAPTVTGAVNGPPTGGPDGGGGTVFGENSCLNPSCTKL